VPPAAGPELGLRLVTDVAMAATVPDGGKTTKVIESLAPPADVTVAVSCSDDGLLDEQPLGGAEIATKVGVKVDVFALVAIAL
jgi:hypothetical protein